MTEECIIQLQTQHELNCASACIAMLLNWEVETVTSLFHEDYWSGRKTESDFLTILNLPHRRCFSDESELKPGHVYLLSTPSINIIGGLHGVILQVTSDNMWYFIDPNTGYKDRKILVVGEPKNNNEFTVFRWIPCIEINTQELKDWREKNESFISL